VTLNAFDVRHTCDTADVQAILTFPPNPLKHVLCDVPNCRRTSNAFNVTMKLQTFLFQMVVTSCISVQYLWECGFAKSFDNLYATCVIKMIYSRVSIVNMLRVGRYGDRTPAAARNLSLLQNIYTDSGTQTAYYSTSTKR